MLCENFVVNHNHKHVLVPQVVAMLQKNLFILLSVHTSSYGGTCSLLLEDLIISRGHYFWDLSISSHIFLMLLNFSQLFLTAVYSNFPADSKGLSCEKNDNKPLVKQCNFFISRLCQW